jgi:hypothetical protein
MYTLTSLDDLPKVVDYLYLKLRFLDIVLELGDVEVVDHFLHFVKVYHITIFIRIDQDVINISTSKQIE